MPSIDHEAPLELFRQAPTLLPALLREALGVTLPAFGAVELHDTDLTEVVPRERRADLVACLRAEGGGPVVLGIIVEVQRGLDPDKRYAWPEYAAGLHARLRCPIALVVLAADAGVARWAARPIGSLQLGSTFTPLVIGPAQVPVISAERARSEPWLAMLAALVHGDGAAGGAVMAAAAEALGALAEPQAVVCYDLLRASLGEAGRRLLEELMQPGKYEYRSDFARHYYREGREEGREEGRLEEARRLVLALAERHGGLDDGRKARVAACADLERLAALAVRLAGCQDAAAVARALDELPVG